MELERNTHIFELVCGLGVTLGGKISDSDFRAFNRQVARWLAKHDLTEDFRTYVEGLAVGGDQVGKSA
jgi:hypothetical protein